MADRPSILQLAQTLTTGARQSVYGHPLEDFTRTGKLWAAILGLPEVTAEQVALCMMAVKISRLCQSPGHQDSVVDAAGYANTYWMVRERRQQKAKNPRRAF